MTRANNAERPPEGARAEGPREGIGTPVSRRDQLVGEIEAIEALLARLAGEESQARSRLAALRAELGAVDATQTRIQVRLPPTRVVAIPTTPEQKVVLFRQLFGGRQDVFPTRFVSKKTGKPGYAPACTNKFVRGVCDLPRIKCGECPNQAFVPVDDAAILAHLRGQHVMGVYPLLDDETCWFLAVDFDKKTWVDDVAAFVATCRDVGLLPSVERSRSGNGEPHRVLQRAGYVSASPAGGFDCS